MNEEKNKKEDLKKFFIKLVSVSIAIVFTVSIIINLLFADRLEKIDRLFSISEKNTREQIKDKIMYEIQSGLDKEQLINEGDKILLYKMYLKLKKEFEDIDEKQL